MLIQCHLVKDSNYQLISNMQIHFQNQQKTDPFKICMVEIHKEEDKHPMTKSKNCLRTTPKTIGAENVTSKQNTRIHIQNIIKK